MSIVKTIDNLHKQFLQFLKQVIFCFCCGHTMRILAYDSEKVASKHYVGYFRIAIKEKYPNTAYLFSAFAVSEKIHATNYKIFLIF